MQKRMRARLPIAGAQWSTHFGMPTRHCRLAVWRPSAWSTAAAAETRSLLFLPYLLMRSQLCTAATEWGVLPAPEMLVPLGTAIPMAQCVRCVTWWKVKSNRKYQSFAFWRSLSLSLSKALFAVHMEYTAPAKSKSACLSAHQFFSDQQHFRSTGWL